MGYALFGVQNRYFLATRNAFFRDRVDVRHVQRYLSRKTLTGSDPAACYVQPCAVCLSWIQQREAVSVPSLSYERSLLHDAGVSAQLCWQRKTSQAGGKNYERSIKHLICARVIYC